MNCQVMDVREMIASSKLARARLRNPVKTVEDRGISLRPEVEKTPSKPKPFLFAPPNPRPLKDSCALVLEYTDMKPFVDRVPRMPRIINMVASDYRIKAARIVGQERLANVVRARQVAMYLTRTLTGLSSPRIGRGFGDKDHTTVMHAVGKITALRATDPQLDQKLTHLERVLSA